jgi:hypothetical protein
MGLRFIGHVISSIATVLLQEHHLSNKLPLMFRFLSTEQIAVNECILLHYLLGYSSTKKPLLFMVKNKNKNKKQKAFITYFSYCKLDEE